MGEKPCVEGFTLFGSFFFFRVWFSLGDPMQEAGRMMKMKIYYLNPAGRRGLESKNSR
jgi:hypothetical protein